MKKWVTAFSAFFLVCGLATADDVTTTDKAPKCAENEVYHEEAGCVQVPVCIKMVQPRYPRKARLNHIEGRVLVRAVITVDGKVKEAKVTEAKPANVGFEEAAVKAVRRWKFRPAQTAKGPVEVYFDAVVDFSLD